MAERRARDGIDVDDSMWPLVVIGFRGELVDEDWRRMFAHYDKLYERREKFHVVNDGMSVKSVMSASQRKLIADAAKAHTEMSRRWCLGGATVVPNAIMRGVVTAITWVAPPAYKLTLHATLPEAVDEALRTLSDREIAVPDSARAYRRALGSAA
jgi:hypothetical protein